MRESDIEAYFVRRVKKLKGWERKFVSPNHSGVPDRIVMLLGWPCPVFVEFKAPGERLRPAQKREHDKIAAAGGFVYVIDSREYVDTLLGN